MKTLKFTVMACMAATLTFWLTNNLAAQKPTKSILVRIDDVNSGAPTVSVRNAPNGYDLYTGPLVANPAIEDGGLITLFGVDQAGLVNPSGYGWRFVDANLPADAAANATDIVWIDHDVDGNLRVGFNTREDGGYYTNPDYTFDQNAGPATNQWVTVYSDDVIELQFKARTP